jgi:hypothetical protein
MFKKINKVLLIAISILLVHVVKAQDLQGTIIDKAHIPKQ